MNKTWKRFFRLFSNGLVQENPLLNLMIGLCSSLAVTTAVANGIGMGLSMTFVLLMSEVVISLFRKIIPESVRIPIFIIIIAAFTTVVDYVLKAYIPPLSRAMGVFIPLIVVNCIIMGRVEGFASKRPLADVIPDALGMGLGYTWVLVGISAVREILGSGKFLENQVLPDSYQPIIFFILPPGGFLVFALFISLNLFLKSRLGVPKGDSPEGEAPEEEAPEGETSEGEAIAETAMETSMETTVKTSAATAAGSHGGDMGEEQYDPV